MDLKYITSMKNIDKNKIIDYEMLKILKFTWIGEAGTGSVAWGF